MYEWDEDKDASNRRKHGIGFEAMERFEWNHATCVTIHYVNGEERELWFGPVDGGIHAVVLTLRDDATRLISLRPATTPEMRLWRKEIQDG